MTLVEDIAGWAFGLRSADVPDDVVALCRAQRAAVLGGVPGADRAADGLARVAARLGLIPSRLAVGPAHAVLESLLPAGWDAQQVYDHHEVFMLHGQRCCFFRAPACGRELACPTSATWAAAAAANSKWWKARCAACGRKPPV